MLRPEASWCRGQDTYFDARVFYPNASSYHSLSLALAYKCHNDAKNVSMANALERLNMKIFTPLVCTSIGGSYGSGGHCLLQETC